MLKRFFLNEKKVMIGILINAIIIFLLYFPQNHENRFLQEFDHFFILFFLLEAIVKWKELKTKKYFESNWNKFDFLIVLVSLPSLLVYFIPIPSTSFLKILRLFRLVRLIRFIHFVPHIEMIIAGIGRAIRASFFVLLVLLFLNFMLALFTCHFYGNYAEEYFGDPLISAYSIFQMFTVEGWNEIPAFIAKQMNDPYQIGVMRFYFVLVVLVGGIFGMSLANAVFVDEMTMDNNKELEDKIDQLNLQMQEIRKLIEDK